MLDKKCTFALCINKDDKEAMCEFQFAYSCKIFVSENKVFARIEISLAIKIMETYVTN